MKGERYYNKGPRLAALAAAIVAKREGYYVFEPTEQDGTSRGRYGPYTREFMRDFLLGLTEHIDRAQCEHAIAITQANPGVAFDLTDVREQRVPRPEGGTIVAEVLVWSARLTWFLKPVH